MYVQRTDGLITGAFANLQPGFAEEELPDDEPELLAFLNPVPSLDERRAAAILRIDAAAEQARLAFITPGSGQALVYESLRREAADYAVNHSTENPPPPGTYPLLEAQIGTVVPDTDDLAADLAAAAAVVTATSAQWIAVAAAIERIRLGAKRAVASAGDAGAIDAVIAGLSWPQPDA